MHQIQITNVIPRNTDQWFRKNQLLNTTYKKHQTQIKLLNIEMVINKNTTFLSAYIYIHIRIYFNKFFKAQSHIN